MQPNTPGPRHTAHLAYTHLDQTALKHLQGRATDRELITAATVFVRVHRDLDASGYRTVILSPELRAAIAYSAQNSPGAAGQVCTQLQALLSA
jgi:hypothetical protein